MSNFEGKMKEKKKLSAFKFMGLCFSSHERSLQPQDCQKYQHFQEHELEQFPKNHNVAQGIFSCVEYKYVQMRMIFSNLMFLP